MPPLNWHGSHLSDGQREEGGGNFTLFPHPLLQTAMEVELAPSLSLGGTKAFVSSTWALLGIFSLCS